MPAKLAASVLAIEFLVHGWDYAAATDHPINVAGSLAEYVLGLAKKAITPQGRASVGFADPIVVAEDAPALDRLIGLTDRDPAALA